jgi:toxin YoeB
VAGEPPEPEHPRRPVFSKRYLEDAKFWNQTSPSVAQRLDRLVSEIMGSPFSGIGKPEPLQHELQGFWSRRLTAADRVIYRVTRETVEFHSARFHYPRGF